ncbi:MAG TPA: peptide chain release factor N(5)-glutamine methyltransferase [Planctomycetes bacterium]|nr:peptide chain release factor N(5)-glutamine methyltransferase [Planctomycetota bacterium]
MSAEHRPEHEQPWTVGRILRWCEDYFRGKGTAAPRLDAELLLARVLGCTRLRLYVDWHKMLEKPELAALRALVARRAAGEPAAYILGEREFWSMRFKVTPDVLVPRPETEHAVEAALEQTARLGLRSPRIADIGTGSGNIACALAKSLPTSTIWAVDVSQAALAVAEENARSLGFAERIRFVRGDMLAPLAGGGPFDVLVSNPPYVTPEEWNELPEEVKKYEPEIALRGAGPEGLGAVERLLVEGLQVLARPGAVVCEIGHRQSDGACALAARAGYRDVTVKRDLAGVPRVVVAVMEPTS